MKGSAEKKEPTLGQKLLTPIIIMAGFWTLAIILWLKSGVIFFLINFGYIGTSVGVGMGLYAVLPRKKKNMGRKLALFLVGGYMLFLLGLVGKENMQIEGFFFYLLAGYAAGAVMHYMVAKIFGPLIFGRAWCGWACWTLMILDLLPFPQSPGRIPGKWGWLRYLHFALSLGLIALLWYVFGWRVDIQNRQADLYWLLAGNTLYYGIGISMAFIFKDNRAFCKYVCPVVVPLKLGSRFALLKIGGDKEGCTGCGACSKKCPMDIRIDQYTQNGQRVLSTECTFCQCCINACPEKNLRIKFGIDAGFRELLRQKEKARQPGQ